MFAKFFEVFAKFFKVFASFLRISRAFRGFRILLDPFGCIRMHSEAIGSVCTFSKNFEIFWIFESFFNVSARNFYKRLFSRHNNESYDSCESYETLSSCQSNELCIASVLPSISIVQNVNQSRKNFKQSLRVPVRAVTGL